VGQPNSLLCLATVSVNGKATVAEHVARWIRNTDGRRLDVDPAPAPPKSFYQIRAQ